MSPAGPTRKTSKTDTKLPDGNDDKDGLNPAEVEILDAVLCALTAADKPKANWNILAEQLGLKGGKYSNQRWARLCNKRNWFKASPAKENDDQDGGVRGTQEDYIAAKTATSTSKGKGKKTNSWLPDGTAATTSAHADSASSKKSIVTATSTNDNNTSSLQAVKKRKHTAENHPEGATAAEIMKELVGEDDNKGFA